MAAAAPLGAPFFTSDGFFNPPVVLAVEGLSVALPFAADTLYLAENAVGLFNPVEVFYSSFSLSLSLVAGSLALANGLRPEGLLFEDFD